MTSKEIRDKYREFFVNHGHKWIPSAPLVPENDPTTLFTSSGMQPLVPYLLGQSHPDGKRLANSQPCFRSQDIEEVGDNRHTTFFEMLGNWSLGDYFKKEQLPWFWEFLTHELELNSQRLYVSVFKGNDQVPKDTESEKIWKSLGVTSDHIFFYGAKKNWWSRSGTPENMPPGEIGGPDSEVFYEFTQREHDKKFGEKCHPNCECGKFLEIGNSVFIQYQKRSDGSLKELPNRNVDFGGGLERLTAATMNEPDIFLTDAFLEGVRTLEAVNKSANDYKTNPKPHRIIVDHLKASIFMVSAGVTPSNKERGYVLRRLIRRAMLYSRELEMDNDEWLSNTLPVLVSPYVDIYPDITKNIAHISEIITQEVDKFRKTLNNGLKEFEKAPPVTYNTPDITYDDKNISYSENRPYLSAKLAFSLFETFGFPLELSIEEAKNRNIVVPENIFKSFKEEKKKHQNLSQTASVGMFKGGLQDHSEITTKYHTATHLLHAALRKVLGIHVQQKGSNITTKRLRFDFSHNLKMIDEEIKRVEELVNEQIKINLPVTSEVMNKNEAYESNALGFFAQKYGDKVTVYTIGNFSREICGGPHVDFTGKLGTFRIEREESAGSGIRRIYAIVGGK